MSWVLWALEQKQDSEIRTRHSANKPSKRSGYQPLRAKQRSTKRLALQTSLLAGILLFSTNWDEMAQANTLGLEAEGIAQAMPLDLPDSEKKQADTVTEASLPVGAVEYNKGCELFSIAKAQGQKGNRLGEKQLLKESLKQFQMALTKNPKLTEAQSNIGFVYLTQRDYRKAIDAFEKALAMNSQHVNTLNGLATAYAFNGTIDKAIQTFDKLTVLSPGNSEYYFNKGSVLQKSGRLPEAQKAYESALKIQPSSQFALFNMGTLLENQGKLEEAKAYYEKAKSVEIGNTAGLEAIQRLDEINKELKRKEAKAP